MNTSTVALTLIGAAFGFLVSCSTPYMTLKHFQEFNGPPVKALGIKTVASSEVIVKPIPESALNSSEGMAKWRTSLKNRGLVQLGSSTYYREGKTDIKDVRLSASWLGARVAYVSMRYIGRGSRTVAVPIAHTPGRTITRDSNTYGNFNSSGTHYGTIGNTQYSGTSHGGGTYSGTTTDSIYVPGTTTYGRERQHFNEFQIMVLFCAPENELSDEGRAKLEQHRALQKNY